MSGIPARTQRHTFHGPYGHHSIARRHRATPESSPIFTTPAWPPRPRILSRKALVRGVTRLPSEPVPDADACYPLEAITRWAYESERPVRPASCRLAGPEFRNGSSEARAL